MLTLHRYDNAAAFLAATESAFQAREIECGLIYGIAERLRRYPERIVEAPYLATVHEGDVLRAAALMTPPRNLLFHSQAEDPRGAFRLVIDDLLRDGWRPPGVNGTDLAAGLFAETWRQASGQACELAMRLRVFELRTVTWPSSMPAGYLRQAGAADVDLVLDWFLAFAAEAMPHEQNVADREGIERGVQEGNFYLWENDAPVSLAAKGRRTAHGVSIGPVYTPPAQRGHGYASAAVATLSQLILDEGWDFCTLFTDQANPTSNSIYQKIGYRAVCDFAEYRFG